MEKMSNTPNPESLLLNKYGLKQGNKISLEKVDVKTESAVLSGTIQEGMILDKVRLGFPLRLDSGTETTSIQRFEEVDGGLLIHTETSIYRVGQETVQENVGSLSFDDISEVETAKGSAYRYLPDGTTQRFKKVEGKTYEQQSALVYVPDYNWIKANAPEQVLKQLGENELIYHEILLDYVQNPRKDGRKVYIIDKTGKKIETNEEIKNSDGPVYLAFISDGSKADFTIPVSYTPKLGWMAFDTRRYVDEETGESMRERHLGNAVVKITTKNNTATNN